MEISSTQNTATTTTQHAEEGKDPMKKAMEVQEKQVLKVLEGIEEQTKDMNAQKTGMGNNLNITG